MNGLAVFVACGSSDEQNPAGKEPDPPRIADAAGRVTSPYVTADGAPGAALQAFCRETKPLDDLRELAPGVTAKRLDGEVCEVEASASARDAIVAVLRTWSQFDAGKVLVGRTTMGFEITAESARVSWAPHAPLEEIIGTNGRLLVGFDVARVVGKPPTALRDAVSSPYKITDGCTAAGCSAYGLRAPGGGKVSIHHLRRADRIAVSLSTTRELVPRVRELITATLGPGQQDGPNTRHIHVKDGVRYLVRDEENGAITILIDKAP